MATKSQQLLTEPAQLAADELRDLGWRQKEYLSAGVIALVEASPAKQIELKAKAYNLERFKGGPLERLAQTTPKEFRALIKKMPDEEQKSLIDLYNALKPVNNEQIKNVILKFVELSENRTADQLKADAG